ncbi:MAG: shikimate dehydrogenase [Lachnospiraceae bacterium]|nr:shikimate dehydrogenase [Lachnospiraceae bacterium]
MEISGKTGLTGLIGCPVSHSISPKMHNLAFQALGLDYVYLAFDLGHADFRKAIEGLREIGILGFNVTMPYKIKILDLMDELTPAADLAGSCNTVIAKDGRLIGHTTDGIGFMHSVQDFGHDIIGKKMSVLGAGGAAAPIISQAALDGMREIDIFRRKRPEAFAKTIAFADKVQHTTGCTVHVYDFADTGQMRKSFAESAILVNATNVGMAPDMNACPIPDPSLLHPDLIVYDIIYNPRRTMLFEMAEKSGCPTHNGESMILFQGAASFQCWTGKEMPVDLIRSQIITTTLA